MSNRTVTVTDAKGNFIAAADFKHNCFPELSDYVPAHIVGAALSKASHSFDVGTDYVIRVTKKSSAERLQARRRAAANID